MPKIWYNVPKVRTKYESKYLSALARQSCTQRPSSSREIRKRMKKSGFPFALTVEDLETTTATTSWISSVRVGAPCPLRTSGPCSSG